MAMPAAASNAATYPCAPEEELKKLYVGKSLHEITAPVAIIDRSIATRNCSLMLDAAERLGVSFRAHVKTHKVNLALADPDVRNKQKTEWGSTTLQ